MFKAIILAAVFAPGVLHAESLSPEQTGVINKTDPFFVETFPTSVNDQIPDVVSQEFDDDELGTDCEGTDGNGPNVGDNGCASDSHGAEALPPESG